MDMGKSVQSATGDIGFAVRLLRYYAGYADKIHGKTLPADGLTVSWTIREPVGVVGAIVPWNYPFFLACLKLAPALCCGCTVVLKPAEQSPLSALYLGKLIAEAGPFDGTNNTVSRLHARWTICRRFVDKIGPGPMMGWTEVERHFPVYTRSVSAPSPHDKTSYIKLFLVPKPTSVPGFPPGVVNVVPGYGETAGAALSTHPDVDAVSFTGSTEVGQLITKAAASTIKRVKLELGGKSPLVIFADCDFEKAALTAHESAMVNHGQCCVAATRTFVEASIYDKMVQRLKELAESRIVGDPFDESTIQGPQVCLLWFMETLPFPSILNLSHTTACFLFISQQVDKVQFDKVMSYIALGQKEGARLVTGGGRVGQRGYFIQPTVFADVTNSMRLAREEIFGPVQSILRFTTFEEAVQLANDTHYGLGAGVFTSDMDKAVRMVRAIRAGSVWINCYNLLNLAAPFGGFKMSGSGREL
ncbi:unnamed protein product [Protopolystoma xenopodis]|uniref:Aldehyde dehydrogenase domain-containing protein n=1 Tax=Protopolystoma xenopodis TaxID=117903 RepID=A0A3S5AM80_9PLAT|nr:unnamed protein product [Protopolystoma xenopodis]